jgi:DUF2934 family protein
VPSSAKEELMASRRSPDSRNPTGPAPPAEGTGKSPPQAPKPAAGATPRVTLGGAARVKVTLAARRALIAENAYLRAQRRGFEPGHETEDWLAAEAEVDALLRAEHGGSPQ